MIRAGRHRDKIVRLIEQSDDPPEGGWPELAVIVAARNEEAEIEAAVRSLLAQDYPSLRVIAVDDRSTDDTGAILDRIAAEDLRLQVVHVRELPPGWLGKTHALHEAAMATDAPWLLFTDADVVFAPGALRRAVAYAVTQRLDHVSVAPDVPTEQVGERLFLAMFQTLFALSNPFWNVENPDSHAHAGIGAFNLVRATSFRAIGGFGRLALSVDDDMKLAESLKAAGGRARVLLGGKVISVRWQVGLGGMIRGLEKNFFAVTGYRVWAALVATVLMFWVGAAPHAGLFVGPWWARVICGLGVLTIAVFVGLTGVQSRVGWYYALTMPISALVCAFAMGRSMWLTLWRRGVHGAITIIRWTSCDATSSAGNVGCARSGDRHVEIGESAPRFVQSVTSMSAR